TPAVVASSRGSPPPPASPRCTGFGTTPPPVADTATASTRRGGPVTRPALLRVWSQVTVSLAATTSRFDGSARELAETSHRSVAPVGASGAAVTVTLIVRAVPGATTEVS